jgi:myo-inositol-1(or 4)-monophosphatase
MNLELDYPKEALDCAVNAARAAGKTMRENFRLPKKINSATQHDIKLELDVRCQKQIEGILGAAFPEFAILGEEGVAGDPNAPFRWVVDPIDGTVNFTYGIPHSCVSIALQGRGVQGPRSKVQSPKSKVPLSAQLRYETIVGVVYDPFCEELWSATAEGPAHLNGEVIHASRRKKLGEAIVSIGFAKHKSTMDRMLPTVNRLIHRVRKIRIMGAAALSMVYVASGRMDAYLEYGLRLWDIAAGGLILERAGGEFWHRPLEGEHTYELLANNGLLRQQLQRLARLRQQR